jgi:hypothetical protein
MVRLYPDDDPANATSARKVLRQHSVGANPMKSYRLTSIRQLM